MTPKIELTSSLSAVKTFLADYLPYSSHSAQAIFESTPFIHVAHAAIKNLAYIVVGEEKFFASISQFFSTRFTYLESALLCVTSFVHNVAFALFYTAIATLCLYQNKYLNYNFKKHWLHSAHSIIGTTISTAGILSPRYGGGVLTYLWVKNIYSKIAEEGNIEITASEKYFIPAIRKLFKDHQANVLAFIATQEVAKGRMDKEFQPAFEIIKKRLDNAETREDLWKLIVDIYKKFPSNMATEAEASELKRTAEELEKEKQKTFDLEIERRIREMPPKDHFFHLLHSFWKKTALTPEEEKIEKVRALSRSAKHHYASHKPFPELANAVNTLSI